MTLREILGSIPGLPLVIGLGLGLLWAWEQRRKRLARGVDLDTNDPLWIAALERARAELPRFRQLAATHPTSAFVKYPLQTTRGTTEHVWGPLVSFGEGTIRVGLETPPIDGAPRSEPPYDLDLAAVEDWRVEEPSGRIFGGYTAKAQIAYLRKIGHKVPAHMLEIERCLVDA